jgi:hypothetical protein
VIGSQAYGEVEAAIVHRGGEHVGESFVSNGGWSHEDQSPPPEVVVVHRHACQARDAKVRQVEVVRAADELAHILLHLEVVQHRSQIVVVHSHQCVVNLQRRE